MNKKIIRSVIAIAIIAVISLCAYEIIFFIPKIFDSRPDADNPASLFLNYRYQGSYSFDPQNILRSIESKELNLFSPSIGNTDGIQQEYNSISWTQSDFLTVANEVSKLVWDEPLELNTWDVYLVNFEKGCDDNLDGFSEFDITYYRILKDGWERVYAARSIEVRPWRGEIYWGWDNEFKATFIAWPYPWQHRWWRSIDFANFDLSAEDALRVAESNGGNKARVKVDNNCSIYVMSYQRDNGKWKVVYFLTEFKIDINPYSGKHKVIGSNQ